MKIKILIIVSIGIIIFFLINSLSFEKKKEVNVLLLPSLPRPIAKEYMLITSAGQSTEAYIIEDIANKLMIHNYFMPQAKASDLEGINTVVFVVGYSDIGEKLSGVSFEAEKRRITELLKKSKQDNLVVITIYLGGKERREKSTNELLQLICPYSKYLIGTKESNSDDFLSELAKKSGIPLTLTNGVNDISEPFASAFR